MYNKCFSINVNNGQVEQMPNMWVPRSDFGIVLSNNQMNIFCAGGNTSLETNTPLCEWYDIEWKQWFDLPKLSESKSDVSLYSV